VERLYREEGLSLRRRRRRNRQSHLRVVGAQPLAANQTCFNEHVFLSLDDAWSKIERWRIAYNRERPRL
jgi:putative transposase